jgi:outer membrane biosynthesis protein TonB
MPMPEQGAVNRSAAPGGARIPATGAHDASALNRPPFAGALPHPGSPAATADPVKAQRPTPRPIVIEHFTPESLLPAQTGRHPGANTPQPPAGPPRGPKESNFVASNGASGHVDSPELTPSEVAAALESEPVSPQEPSLPRFLLPLTIGAVVVLALALLGVYVLRTHINSTPPVVETYQDPPLPTQADTTPPGTAAEDSAPAPAAVGSGALSPGDAATPAAPQGQPTAATAAAMTTAAAAPSEAVSPSETTSSSEIHEEIPEIPPRIRESIRGHVRVAVRLIVDKEGSVFAALVDEPGPSRYFERLAIDAAKKWTFPPLDTTGSRLELVRFDFTRQGATGRVVEIE